MNDPELILATCSYREFHPTMGVPVATSIGRNKQFEHAVQCDALKPWTTFRKMSDRPLSEQCERYQRQLDESSRRVRTQLLDIQREYVGEPLVILCWCYLPQPDTGPMGCHRRWFAAWLGAKGIDVPELGRGGDTLAPLVAPEPTLF